MLSSPAGVGVGFSCVFLVSRQPGERAIGTRFYWSVFMVKTKWQNFKTLVLQG